MATSKQPFRQRGEMVDISQFNLMSSNLKHLEQNASKVLGWFNDVDEFYLAQAQEFLEWLALKEIEAQEYNSKMNRYQAIPHKRAALYRKVVAMKDCSFSPASIAYRKADGLQDGKDKNASCLWLVWRANLSSKSLDLTGHLLQARQPDCPKVLPIMSISKHALARMFQRLKTCDRSKVLENLADIVQTSIAIPHDWHQGYLQDEILNVVSKDGVALMRKDAKNHFISIMVTWLSDDELFPNQMASVNKVRNGDLKFFINSELGL